MIRWDDTPPNDALKPLRIVRASHAYNTRLLVLSNKGIGVHGHWQPEQRRNLPCLWPNPCYCDVNPVTPWWRFYLGVWTGSVVAIAEISKTAYKAGRVEGHLRARGTLRGLYLTLSRSPRVKTGEVVAELSTPATLPDDARLGPEPDLALELQRIWYRPAR